MRLRVLERLYKIRSNVLDIFYKILRIKPHYYSYLVYIFLIVEILSESLNISIIRFLSESFIYFVILQVFLCLILFFLICSFTFYFKGTTHDGQEIFISISDEFLLKKIDKLKKRDKRTREHELPNVYEIIYPRIQHDQILAFINIINIILSIIVIFSFLSMSLHLFFIEESLFKDLNNYESILKYVYYVLITFLTIGYGDIYPSHLYGYIFIFVLCIVHIWVYTIGISVILNLIFSYTQKIEEQIKIKLEL